MNKDAISVVLPSYDLADIIGKTLSDTYDYLSKQTFFLRYEVIVVDDGSRDKTAQFLKDAAARYPSLKVVTHSENEGYGAALLSGLHIAQYSSILFMDADGQFQISSLVDMQPFLEDDDIITGYRSHRRDSVYRILLGKMYTWFACRLFDLSLKDINCGFKLFKKDRFNFDEFDCHAGVFYTDFFIQAREKGCRIKEVPVAHFPRVQGKQTGASLEVIIEALRDLYRLASRQKKAVKNIT
ncbi:MAG: glycosyltransferase family 2 protein [Candidatus Omnitrophica bacterium]|nr:glycosyltransferase family 2 protein [Candidatus Omnitrophota bacterium]